MMGGGMMGSFGGFGWIGLLLNLALLVGIVLLVVWAVQKFSHSTNSSSPVGSSQLPLSAREILDIRYAKGELTREEYQTRLSDITS